MGRETVRPEKRKRPRTCIGCGEESPKRTLLRVVRTPEGEVRIDPSGKAPGRGAYVCLRRSCVLAARKKDALSRCLRTKVPSDIYDNILDRCPAEEKE